MNYVWPIARWKVKQEMENTGSLSHVAPLCIFFLSRATSCLISPCRWLGQSATKLWVWWGSGEWNAERERDRERIKNNRLQRQQRAFSLSLCTAPLPHMHTPPLKANFLSMHVESRGKGREMEEGKGVETSKRCLLKKIQKQATD